MSNNKFLPDLSLEERQKKFLEMSDEDIDYSDIPSLDDEFFKNAELVTRTAQTEQVSIRLDVEILEWFRNHAQETSYQTLINDVLRTYVKHQS
ncbi:MAG: BrnA antitoxin family protein [Microcystaceae cyanobacterium]